MFVAIMAPNRLRFAADDLLSATKEEEAQAEETYVSYCGRYEFLGDTVVHHVELSLFPNWIDVEHTTAIAQGHPADRTPHLGARLNAGAVDSLCTVGLPLYGVLRSSQRSEPSEPSGGRGFPCFPSPEELAYGQQQAHKREYDEHDLVDVNFSGRQAAYEVRRPEQRVIP